DLIEGLFAAGGVLVPQSQLGVVDDRREDVVKLVSHRRSERPHGAQLLGLHQLLLQVGDLLLQLGSVVRRSHGRSNLCFPRGWSVGVGRVLPSVSDSGTARLQTAYRGWTQEGWARCEGRCFEEARWEEARWEEARWEEARMSNDE